MRTFSVGFLILSVAGCSKPPLASSPELDAGDDPVSNQGPTGPAAGAGGPSGGVSLGDAGSAGTSSGAGATDASAPAESPTCTTITQPGPSITDASGQTWTLAGPSTDLVVDVDGQPAGTSAEVTRLVYVNHVVSQQNAAGGWWSWANGTWNSEASPVASCGGTSTTGPTPPPQAIAAGYTTLVGGAEFDSPADVSLDVSGGTVAPLYSWIQYASPALGAGDYTIANGALTLTHDTSGWGAGLSTANSESLSARSTPTAHAVNTGHGVVFQYFYAEARMQLDYPTPSGASYYPTFWSNSVKGSEPYLELDVFEIDNGRPDPVYQSFLNWDVEGKDYPTTRTAAPQSAIDKTPGAWNKFGVLWTPTQIVWFINDQPGSTVQMDATTPWGYDANPGASSVIPNAICDIQDQFMHVIVGTGVGWPVSYDWIRVWQ